MQAMLAYCGLDCAGCPIHLATLEPNASRRLTMRTNIARMCAEQYGMNVTTEDVTDCDGCPQSGRLFSGCVQCTIRPCAMGKALSTCAACPEYACEKLLRHFQSEPSARKRLDALRSQP